MFETQETGLGLRPLPIVAGIVVLICMCIFGVWPVWIGFLIVMMAVHVIRDKERTKLITKFASDMGLTFLGNSLPSYFPIQQTSSRLAHSIRRVVIGEEVLLFDCRIGHGKGSRGRTVVAARGEPSVFGWARFGPDLATEQAGEWTLVYGSGRVLQLEEIGALMSEVTHSTSQNRFWDDSQPL